MNENSIILFSTLSSIVLGAFGFLLFLLSFKKDSIFHRSLCRQWCLGFSLISWVQLPTLLFSLGFLIDDVRLYSFYTFAFFASTIGYLLFLRGALIINTENNTYLNILPLFIFTFFISSTIVLFSIFHLSLADTTNFVQLVNTLIVLGVLKIVLPFLNKSNLKNIVKSGIYSFVCGWIIFLFLGIFIQAQNLGVPENVWYHKFLPISLAFILFFFAQAMIFYGILAVGLNIESKPPARGRGFVLGLSSVLVVVSLGLGLVSTSVKSSSKISFVSSVPSFVVVGQDIIGNVHLANGQPMNAVDIVVSFDNNVLEVENISKENSIISLWVDEPIYDNDVGKIEFSGVIPGGFNGEGDLLSISFKTKHAGNGRIKFTRADVFANDGNGTIIQTEKFSKTYYVRTDSEPLPTFDQGGKVTLRDLSTLVGNFGTVTIGPNRRFDLNKDGVVNLVDLSVFVSLMKQ